MECRKSPAQFCCQECFGGKALCLCCLLQSYVYSPLHWIQEWTGEYFEHRDLSELGFIHHLGHQGNPCSHLPSTPTTTTLVVTHVNGIHEVKAHFCHCQGRQTNQEQLILSHFIPASWTKAQSVFTIEVLEDFHEDTLSSKKSAYDYVRKLRRRKNNSCAHEVQVQHHVLRGYGNPLKLYSKGPILRVHVRCTYLAIIKDVQTLWTMPRNRIPKSGYITPNCTLLYLSLARGQSSSRLGEDTFSPKVSSPCIRFCPQLSLPKNNFILQIYLLTFSRCRWQP